MSETKKIVGWDGDNTLWGWLEYAVPAYEAMSEVIAEIAGKSVSETVEAMNAFYTQAGSIEDEGLVQGLHALGFFSGVRDFDEAATIARTKETFARVQRENMRVYPGIGETIETIDSMGYEQILVSDAPVHKARARMEDLGLLGKIPLTFGLRPAQVPRLPAGRPRPPIHADMIMSREKPHSANELAVKLALTRDQLAALLTFVGDSKPKDMRYAENIGCVGVHSLWGIGDPKLVERILKFAPKNVARRHMQLSAGTAPVAGSRILTANKPSELVEILKRAG